MDKSRRKAVRCYLIQENKVVVIKYKEGNKKQGYYDIPGGKIEDGEVPRQTAIREMKEETGINIKKLENKGNMIIEYPNRIFDLDVFLCNNYEGKTQEFEENTSEWIDIEELLHKEKILSSIMLLDRFFIEALIDENVKFSMYIKVDENEKVIEIKYIRGS